AVCAAPVPRAAGAAARERLAGAPGAGLQQRLHLGLGDRAQQAVAGGAPGPGGQQRREPVQYVGGLVIGGCAVHVGTQPQGAPAQQPAVLGQQDPPPGVGVLDHGVVAGLIGIRGLPPAPPPRGRGAGSSVPRGASRMTRAPRPSRGRSPAPPSTTPPPPGRSRGGTGRPLTTSRPTSVSGTPSDCTT